jgi:hypothetical protein
MAPPTSVASLRSVFLLPLLGLAACGGARYVRVVSVNPPDATVYVNGEAIGQGSSRTYTFDFSNVERIFVQATHPEYQPAMEVFTRSDIEQRVAANLDVKLTLRAR